MYLAHRTCSALDVSARNPVSACSIMQLSRCRCPFVNDQTGLGDPGVAKKTNGLESVRLRVL